MIANANIGQAYPVFGIFALESVKTAIQGKQFLKDLICSIKVIGLTGFLERPVSHLQSRISALRIVMPVFKRFYTTSPRSPAIASWYHSLKFFRLNRQPKDEVDRVQISVKSDNELAAATIRLGSDRGLQVQLGKESCKITENQYDIPKISVSINRLLKIGNGVGVPTEVLS